MNSYGHLTYTYVLKCIPNGKRYYGVRFANKCSPEQDLGIKYFSSSNHVKKLIEQYGKGSFEFQVRKTFQTKASAQKWEAAVLRRLKVLTNQHLWLNKSIPSGRWIGNLSNYLIKTPKKEEISALEQESKLRNVGQRRKLDKE
jgi:hypothetical protein